MTPAFTPGPWAWFGNTNSTFYLATTHSGRRYVMGFARKGMQHAEPTFQIDKRMVKASELAIFEVCQDAIKANDPRVYRADIIGFRSADAELIADAPELYKALDALHGVIAAISGRVQQTFGADATSVLTEEEHQAIADAEMLLCKHQKGGAL